MFQLSEVHCLNSNPQYTEDPNRFKSPQPQTLSAPQNPRALKPATLNLRLMI